MFASLTPAMGEPDLMVSIPGQLLNTANIYWVLDETTQCIDTFVTSSMSNGELIIMNYFCR